MISDKILTISIAAYNMQEFLPRCLDSLLHEKVLHDIEILVINDGSKDDTLKIAQSYQKKYPFSVKAIDKENGGWGSTVNLGMQIATGKYFKLLDADDWFDTNLFVEFVHNLKNVNVDLVITPYSKEFIYEGKSKYYGFKAVTYSETYDFQNWAGYYNCGTNWFDLPSITYKTEILQKNNIKISECFYSDIEYDCYPLKYVQSIVFLDNCIYKYFIGRAGQSISAEGATRHYPDHLYITQKMIDYYLDNECSCSSSILKSIYLNIALAKISLNYKTLMSLYSDRKKAKKMLNEFDLYIKNRNYQLYVLVEQDWKLKQYIKPLYLWREYGFNIYQTTIYKLLFNVFMK